MSRVVVDTSVFVDHLRGDPEAIAFLVDLESRRVELWSSVVVRTELRAGMKPSERESTQRLIDAIRWVDVTKDVADRAGAFANTYLRSHRSIDTVDYLVAATTVQLDATLVTKNVKHFPMFRALRAPY